MACRFLTMTGRRHMPVAAGAAPAAAGEINATGQYRYYYHPDVLFNRTTRPVKESAVDFLYARLKAQPGKITLVAAGPLTNIARLLTEKPDCKPWIKRIVFVGGSHGPTLEANLRADVKAAQAVLASGVPLVVVPLDATVRLKLTRRTAPRLRPGTALTLQVQALSPALGPGYANPGRRRWPSALCLDERFCELEDAAPGGRTNGAFTQSATASPTPEWRRCQRRGVPEVVRRAARPPACRLRTQSGEAGRRRAACPTASTSPRTTNRHRALLVDERQGGDEEPAARQQPRLPRRADPRLRRPAGQHRRRCTRRSSSTRCPARRWARTPG